MELNGRCRHAGLADGAGVAARGAAPPDGCSGGGGRLLARQLAGRLVRGAVLANICAGWGGYRPGCRLGGGPPHWPAPGGALLLVLAHASAGDHAGLRKLELVPGKAVLLRRTGLEPPGDATAGGGGGAGNRRAPSAAGNPRPAAGWAGPRDLPVAPGNFRGPTSWPVAARRGASPGLCRRPTAARAGGESGAAVRPGFAARGRAQSR